MAEKHDHVGEFTIDRATGEETCDDCNSSLDEPVGGLSGPGRCWSYINSRNEMHEDDKYPNEGFVDNLCRGCGKFLATSQRRIADGCPCNAPRGINHGLVPKNTCTCVLCDPAQTGGTRISQVDEPSLSDVDIHTEWERRHGDVIYKCRIERIWRPQGQPVVVEYLRDDAMRTSNMNEQQFLLAHVKSPLDADKYPNGKLNADDKGALQIAIGIDKDVVVLDFGKPVTWFGMKPDMVDAMCRILQANADRLRKNETSEE